MSTEICYLSVQPHLRRLRYLGFYQLPPKTVGLKRLFHVIYRVICLSLILFYALQGLIKLHQVNYQISKLVDIMFIWITFMNAIVKCILMWRKSEQLEDLLNRLKDPQFNRMEPHHFAKLKRVSKEHHILVFSFNMLGIVTCLLWTIFPFILRRNGVEMDFAIWLPMQNLNEQPQFNMAVLYIWVQTTYLGFNNTTIDAMIAYFMAHIKVQITILREDLQNLVVDSEKEAVRLKMPSEVIMHKSFVRCIKHFAKITSFADDMQRLFNVAFLAISLTFAWIICTSTYRLLKLDVGSVEFFSVISYLGCIFVDLALLCYYGNEVTYESEQLLRSAYQMDWLKLPINHRKSLIILMERLKRPILIKGGGIIPLSAATFITLLRTSYTCFTFLKETDE